MQLAPPGVAAPQTCIAAFQSHERVVQHVDAVDDDATEAARHAVRDCRRGRRVELCAREALTHLHGLLVDHRRPRVLRAELPPVRAGELMS
jgi:hypothetical protein